MNHNFFPERGEGLTDGNCSYYVFKITIRLLVQRTVGFIQCAWFLSYFIKIFNLLRHEEFHFAHITTCGFSFDIYTLCASVCKNDVLCHRSFPVFFVWSFLALYHLYLSFVLRRTAKEQSELVDVHF